METGMVASVGRTPQELQACLKWVTDAKKFLWMYRGAERRRKKRKLRVYSA